MLRRFVHSVFSTFDMKMFQNIFVSKMMTSTRKGKARDAAPDPGTVVMSKLSLAASEARKATMASIAELLDNAAAKNGGRVPQGFVPKVIRYRTYSKLWVATLFCEDTHEQISNRSQGLEPTQSGTPSTSGDCRHSSTTSGRNTHIGSIFSAGGYQHHGRKCR